MGTKLVSFPKRVRYKHIQFPPNTAFEVDDSDVVDLLQAGGWIIEKSVDTGVADELVSDETEADEPVVDEIVADEVEKPKKATSKRGKANKNKEA